MNAVDLNLVLEKHRLWLAHAEGGERADLRDADLRGAWLRGANMGFNCCFAGAIGQPVYQVHGVGATRRALTLHARGARGEWVWFAGCFRGDENELRESVRKKYGDDGDYMDAMALLVKMAERHACEFNREKNDE